MSDVAVARRVDAVQGLPDFADPLEARGGKVTPELSRVALAESGGKVQFYAVAYPPAPIDAPVDASIEIWRDGQLLLKSPASEVPLDSMGTASILASLPSAKLPPGDYEAHITFEFKGQRVMKAVPFTTSARHVAASSVGAEQNESGSGGDRCATGSTLHWLCW